MLSAAMVREIEAAAWFADTTRPYLVVDDGLRIRAVNGRYEEVTIHPRSVLLGGASSTSSPMIPATGGPTG